MFARIGMQYTLTWFQLYEIIKIVHRDKGLMHVIVSYFTRVLFVACTDFKSSLV